MVLPMQLSNALSKAIVYDNGFTNGNDNGGIG